MMRDLDAIKVTSSHIDYVLASAIDSFVCAVPFGTKLTDSHHARSTKDHSPQIPAFCFISRNDRDCGKPSGRLDWGKISSLTTAPCTARICLQVLR